MTVSDGQQSVSVVFYIRVVPPPFHVHRRLSVFAAAAPAVTTVDKAVFGVWRVPCVTIPHVVGRVVLAAEMEAGQLSCVAGTGEINAYRRCRCGKYASTAQEMDVSLENDELSSAASVELSGDGTGSLRLQGAQVPFVSGVTTVRFTLLDGDDAPYYADAILEVRHVNQAPSFAFRNVTVRENSQCRAQKGWDLLRSNMSSDAPVACRYLEFNVTSSLLAGNFPERCLNCGQQAAPCNTSGPESFCVQQSVSFHVEHVSDSSIFHTKPFFSVDGSLSFALFPEATGVVSIWFRLLDDGGYNAVPSVFSLQHPGTQEPEDFERPCSNTSTIPCGSAAGAALQPKDNGTDVSGLAVLTLLILPVNQQPSIVLDRDVECLDSRDVAGSCMCASSASPLLENARCRASADGKSSITVLEDSGLLHVHGFARQISAGGGVPSQLALFEFEQETLGKVVFDGKNLTLSETRIEPPGEGNPSFVEMRSDPQTTLGGLEGGVHFASSPDGAHAYVAERLSNSLAALHHADGDNALRFLDRRAEDEHRIRFVDAAPFATQNPCSATAVSPELTGNETFIALMQGCELLSEDKQHLPSHRAGDSSLVDSKEESFGYLGKHTVFFYQMQSRWMRGLYYRPKQTASEGFPCQKGRSHKYDTYINPGRLLDSTGNFPDAVMETQECLIDTYQDTRPGEQPSLLTYLMNDGITEALNFDGTLMQALWITRELRIISHMFPASLMTLEVWFTVESPKHPITRLDIEAAGLISAAGFKKGWDLYYSVIGHKLRIFFAMALKNQEGFGMRHLLANCHTRFKHINAQ